MERCLVVRPHEPGIHIRAGLNERRNDCWPVWKVPRPVGRDVKQRA
jgi:hypothetical protein